MYLCTLLLLLFVIRSLVVVTLFNFCRNIQLCLKLRTKKKGAVLILLSSHFSLASALYLRVVIIKGYEIINDITILKVSSDHISF